MFNPGKKMDIVVVGGSLAGLMTSIPLLRHGHNVTILERSPTPLLHNQGAGIVAGGETQAFFRHFDRSSRRGEIGITSPTRLYLNRKGDEIDREDYEQRMTSWDLLYYLARANFDAVKTEYLNGFDAPEKQNGEGAASYEHGCLVKDVQTSGDKVSIIYEDVRKHEDSNKVSSTDGPSPIHTVTADFLIAADGPSSSLREILIKDAPARSYAGYVAFRGTVPETQLSSAAKEVMVEKFTFFHGLRTQILAYTIPGAAGTLKSPDRLINWVWYWNYAEGSDEYKDLMTDVEGKAHRFTLPTGGAMRPKVREDIKRRAWEVLAPQFAELVEKTDSPFVQAITDLPPPPSGTPIARLLNGKAMIVGDAVSGFRPHTAASTSQAALHALLLNEVFGGRMGWEEYEKRVMKYAQSLQERGVVLGDRSQFKVHPMADRDDVSDSVKTPVERKELWMRK